MRSLLTNTNFTATTLRSSPASNCGHVPRTKPQAAIAALHDDARTAGETDWPQILAWYDELIELTDNPVAALSRAVAVGEVDGPLAGLAAAEELATPLGDHHRLDAGLARLHEQAGHPGIAAQHYTRAAAQARNTAERDYLTKQAARLRHR